MKSTTLSLLIAALLAADLSAQAFDLIGFEGHYDLLLHLNSDPDSAPSPLIGTIGGSARFAVTDHIEFAPGLSLFSTDYFYRDGRALPAEIEYADAVTVLGLSVETPWFAVFGVSEGIDLAVGLSPTLFLRIPLVPHGDDPTVEVMTYYYGGFRIIFLEAIGEGRFAFSKSLSLLVRARLLFPLFRLWDGVPIYDELATGLGAGISYRF